MVQQIDQTDMEIVSKRCKFEAILWGHDDDVVLNLKQIL